MAKKGNKDKQRQLRRHRQLTRRRAKRANILFRLPGARTGNKLPGLDAFTDAEHLFWVAHGINFIASDFTEAIWQPLFPEIYDGNVPSEEALAQRVMSHYTDDLESNKPTTGKVATAWAIQDKATVFTFRDKALRSLRETDPSHPDPEQAVLSPHISAVWRVFFDMKAQVLRDMA